MKWRCCGTLLDVDQCPTCQRDTPWKPDDNPFTAAEQATVHVRTCVDCGEPRLPRRTRCETCATRRTPAWNLVQPDTARISDEAAAVLWARCTTVADRRQVAKQMGIGLTTLYNIAQARRWPLLRNPYSQERT